ncbi:PhoH family protein [Alphaproteobacteria bacterium]|jgi:phosphate starvation-inducible PhoH-like protein|nr:PhoH family protein [Alphaproteobacteria bacterium]NCF49594.1 AAA family ATPase [Bacteroidota bacterium]
MTKSTTIRMDFEDNGTLALLTGEHSQNLAQLEAALGVSLDSFGNSITISGLAAPVKKARRALEDIYRRIGEGDNLLNDNSMIDDALRWVESSDGGPTNGDSMDTWKKKIIAKTPGQKSYAKLLRAHEVVFGLGPAGTGKTYMAVAKAVESLKKREVERIVLSRPAVEAGERLGFLPGDMKEKVDPYLRPLYDALYDMMPADKVDRMLVSGEIEIAPLAFMRGRTLSESYVIIDEAQNTTPVQMKMVLTRLGQNSRMVITGDLSQIDLPDSQPSGLADAVGRLDNIEGVGIIHLSGKDVVRHPVVARILQAYDSN